MKLLECSDQAIQLRGYSRTSSFQLRNLHSHLYVSFKISSTPQGEFIVIPEEGLIAPFESKDFRIYLSKGSLYKEELPNSYIQIIGGLDYRYNEGIVCKREHQLGKWEELMHVSSTTIVPVVVSSEYSQLKSEARSGSVYSRGSKASRPFGSFNHEPRPLSQEQAQLTHKNSFQSSISMHSDHLIEDEDLLATKPAPSRGRLEQQAARGTAQRAGLGLTSLTRPSGTQEANIQPLFRSLSPTPQQPSKFQSQPFDNQLLFPRQPSTPSSPLFFEPPPSQLSASMRKQPLRAIDMLENVMNLAAKEGRSAQKTTHLQQRKQSLQQELDLLLGSQKQYKDQSTEFLIMVFFIGLFISFGSQLRYLFY